MTSPRPSAFRDGLQVSQERIAALDDAGLNILMGELFLAQAYRCGASVSEIRINTEDKAKDDGCDGWSPKPNSSDDWLGSGCTCWQFKAGAAGEPAVPEDKLLIIRQLAYFSNSSHGTVLFGIMGQGEISAAFPTREDPAQEKDLAKDYPEIVDNTL